MSENVERNAHYIIALPPSGIPKKVMRLIESIRKMHGVAHTTLYQTPNSFSMRPTQNKFIRTNFWIEISDQPLPKRLNPDWPLESQRPASWR